jgi:TonB family protein
MRPTALALVLPVLLVAALAGAKPAPKPRSDVTAARIPDCRPERLRSLLHAADTCVVGKACGRIDRPWAYRGPFGSRNSVKIFGGQVRGAEFTHTLASLLVDSVAIDSAHAVHSLEVSCESGDSIPVFIVRFDHQGEHARALLRFDTGQVLFYADREALGSVRMGDRADTLWNIMRDVLTWDGYMAGARPEAGDGAALDPPGVNAGEFVYVNRLPEAIDRKAPKYPNEAIENNVEGVVFVVVLVGADGNVQDAYIGDGPAPLFDSALEAVWQWKFRPAGVNGKDTAVWVMVPVTYTLR